MNLLDSAFLCLDLGAHSVRALGVRVRAGRVVHSVIKTKESGDIGFAIKSAVDELEQEIGRHFDSAHVTGDFGFVDARISTRTTDFGGEHKITPADVQRQISEALVANDNSDSAPMHIIPLRYDIGTFKNLATPIGQTDRMLASVFHIISYSRADLAAAQSALRAAHIESDGFFDPMYLIGRMLYKSSDGAAAFIDLGAAWTSIAVWTSRGLVFLAKIPMGQNKVTDAIADGLKIPFPDAERAKKENFSATTSEMDRFTVADAQFELSRADVIDAGLPALRDVLELARDALQPYFEKYDIRAMNVSGGGANIPGIESLCGEIFAVPIHNLGPDAAINACAKMVWSGSGRRIQKYLARRARWEGLAKGLAKLFTWRRRKKRPTFIPIMPATLTFNMHNPDTYKMFDSAGISMIHVDVMDGFYVDRITGSMEELRFIRAHTRAHLNVHLMTENPTLWADQAAAVGADTIIVSTGTNGVRAALRRIRELGKRCGVALHPDSSLDILRPILKEVDEILIMSIVPGAAGQKFLPDALYKISTLANTRRRYGLKFKISVDGGINADTAKECWDAGADFLASGSYLANAADFPLAVQSLLPQ